ncbi:hypothetical protein QVD17_30742 [Tagetes erecta]|uniref:FAR1 domain-containing protein n=1 Tax=Tagetes erecta TaxID=13708 RepID=A0AAD8NNK8_TARER|nr:hypothetical protein QVD17_30742 [Tagetes erecta]
MVARCWIVVFHEFEVGDSFIRVQICDPILQIGSAFALEGIRSYILNNSYSLTESIKLHSHMTRFTYFLIYAVLLGLNELHEAYSEYQGTYLALVTRSCASWVFFWVKTKGFDSSTYVPRGIERSSLDASNKYYIPDVLEDLKPKVGMTFDNIHHAFAHYCKYVVASGFSVRKATDSKSRNGVIKLKYYLCSKEGFNQKKKVDTLEENAKQ